MKNVALVQSWPVPSFFHTSTLTAGKSSYSASSPTYQEIHSGPLFPGLLSNTTEGEVVQHDVILSRVWGHPQGSFGKLQVTDQEYFSNFIIPKNNQYFVSIT